ncbi:outer membrane protein assembly factor BamA [candidate division WOR-3 bacterium]|nr:outer membrane protein assembly factor BamA [candidate division WOR-3 bacterium]
MFALLLLASFPYGEVIIDIGVRGVKEVDTALVVRSSGFKIGEVLTSNKAVKAIKNLYATGLFRDIKLDAEREGAGIRVIVDAQENPRLKSIDFKGNEKLKDADLASMVDLSPPALLSDYKIFNIKKKILKLYKDKGISGTEISISEEEKEGGVRVVFNIKEGQKFKVKGIRFNGNRGLSNHDLSSVLSNKTKPWWMLWRNNDLKVDSVGTDVYKIESVYRKKGYLDATVDTFFITYEGNKSFIDYEVSEGRLYYFGETHLQGDMDKGFVSTKIKWDKGERYDEEKIQKTMQGLYNYYTDNGFLYASIFPEYSVVGDSLIEVTLHVDKGVPVYIKHIDIAGNSKTYDKVIRRNLTVYPGELFHREELIDSQRNLFRLGYFEDLSLNVENPGSADSVNLVFSIKEKQTGQFTAGIGYSQSVGLTGNVGATMPNIFGTGQSVNFSYERSLRSGTQTSTIQNITLGYRQPWLFDTPTSIGFDLYKVYYRWQYFGQDKAGGSFSLGRILTAKRNLQGTVMYKLERTELEVIDENASDYIKSQEGTSWESSIGGKLVFDSRDSHIAASVGNYYSLSTKYAGGVLGGGLHYWKAILETRKFHTLFDKFVLMNRSRVGYAHSPVGEAPLTERFFLGGIGLWGLRGYDDREIGPYSGIYPTGGSFALLNNLEIRYNFSKTGYGMVFLDAGNCFKDIQETRLSDLFYGMGVGFRMEIPMMGIFGIDMGYGLNEEKGREWKPHFQIGVSY